LVAEGRDQVVGGGKPLGFHQLRRGENRGSVIEDFALPDQVVEGGDRFQDICVVVRPVRLVQVNPVRLQAAEAALHSLRDPAPGVAGVGRVGAHLAMELCGQEDVVAAAPQGTANHLLGFTLRVDVGGVYGSDA
jgi:hypothetical protein